MEQDSAHDGKATQVLTRLLRGGKSRAEPEASENSEAATTKASRRQQLQGLAGKHSTTADHRCEGHCEVRRFVW